jgi:hypothetical protein
MRKINRFWVSSSFLLFFFSLALCFDIHNQTQCILTEEEEGKKCIQISSFYLLKIKLTSDRREKKKIKARKNANLLR